MYDLDSRKVAEIEKATKHTAFEQMLYHALWIDHSASRRLSWSSAEAAENSCSS